MQNIKENSQQFSKVSLHIFLRGILILCSVGEVVNTHGSHPCIQGFEPPTEYQEDYETIFRFVFLFSKQTPYILSVTLKGDLYF